MPGCNRAVAIAPSAAGVLKITIHQNPSMKPNPIPRNSSRGWRCCSKIAALLAGLASAACAQEEGLARKFYFTANLGASMPGETTVKSTDLFIESGKIKFDTGVRLDVGFGYYITDWLSVELDSGILINFTHLKDDFDESGDLGFYQIPVLANLIYHIPTRSRFRPFVGAGIGGVQSQLVDYDLFSGGSDSDFGLAWQALAGCRYQLSSKVDLGIAYKYLATTDRTFDSFGLKMKGTHTHSLTASVLLKF